jgi:hypothetical protein
MKPMDKPLVNPPHPELSQLPSAKADTPARPPAVTILSLLLLLQAAGLIFLNLFFYLNLDLQTGPTWQTVLHEPVETLTLQGAFIFLALLALLAAIGFYRLWVSAWFLAMLLQGLGLLTTLSLYFSQKPDHVYGMMLYSILMVIALNYSEVYLAFQPPATLEESPEEVEAS